MLDSRIGGMERFVIELSLRLALAGHSVTVLTGKRPDDIDLEGVRILRSRIFYVRPFSKFFKYVQLSWIARKHLKNDRYDAVLAMGHSGLFIKDYVWRASGIPVPLIRAERLKEKRGLLSRILMEADYYSQEVIERACIRKAKYHMYPSVHVKSLFEDSYGYKSLRHFIPCSGTGSAYGPEEYPAGDLLKNIPEGEIKVLTVGGLSEKRKGRDVILEAFSLMDLSGITLVCAGGVDATVTGPLKDHFVSLGNVDHRRMPALYQGCDMLIFPSIFEGFPNVLLEAASFGMPVIASRIEGIDEYFTDGEDLILVEKGDAGALSEKILLLAGSEELRKRLSENIKKRIKDIDYGILAGEFVSFVSSKGPLEINLLKKKA